MTQIVVGCPYTEMSGLTKSITKFSSELEIINVSDIVFISYNNLIVAGATNPISISNIRSAFIRYPYDLIPPHSESFELREKTEFLKTVSLMLKHCAINPVERSWQIRNRLYSLSIAKEKGINVPTSQIVANGMEIFELSDRVFVKAMGNCFVSEKETDLNPQLLKFLHREEDDGDIAWIFHAQKFNVDSFAKYVESVGYGFCQNIIKNLKEYRVYIIENELFVYCRDEIEQEDKSKAAYNKVKEPLDNDYIKLLKDFAKDLGLDYLCMDVIENEKGYFLIDINPFGSLPPYPELPEPTDALAKLMIKKAKL